MTITYAKETYADIIEDIKPLLETHWQEVANYKDKVPLKPNFSKYQALEKNKALVIMACRDKEKLIGYSIFFLSRHLHYTTCLVASNDVLFLTKAFRKGRVGIKLIQESERLLKNMGVNRVIWHIKPKNNFSPILIRMGYIQEEIIMGKFLGD